jgi:hypothetical protein
MPQLLFKKEFFDAIRSGRKTTTLRRWKSCWLEQGSRVHCPGVGWLRILSCDSAELAKLTRADARADGFTSLAQLRRTLKRLYPDQTGDGKRWYRVQFQLESNGQPVEPAPVAKPKAPRLRGKDKTRLARRIRADLDKAVRRSGSLFPL